MEIQLRDKKEKLSGTLLMSALNDTLKGINEGAIKSECTIGYITLHNGEKVMITISLDREHKLLEK